MLGAKQTFWVSKDGGPPQQCIDLDYAIGLGYQECDPPPSASERASQLEAKAVEETVPVLQPAIVRDGVVDNSAAVQMPEKATLTRGRRRNAPR